MPIRHFDYFCSEQQLISPGSLTILQDCRIGIEGQYWLRKVLKAGSDSQLDLILASLVATGGTPPYETLSSIIKKELDNFKAYGIIPFFVFNGLAVKRDKPFSFEDLRPSKRDMAWNSYNAGNAGAAFDSWLKSNSVNPADYMQIVFQILHENDVEFMRAPYSVWGQLTYLEKHPKQLIHAVYAGSDMIMWNVDRVILNCDFEHGTFTFIEKARVLTELGVNADTFLEIAILSGFDWIATFPPLQGNYSFKNAVDLATGPNSVFAYAEDPQVMQTGYLETYMKIKTTIRHHLILTDEGRVEPLNPAVAPSDLHEVLGFRLPNQLYYYMCHGMISLQVVNSLLSGYIVESHPLCNGSNPEYRKFVKSQRLLEARATALGLLTSNLNRYFSTYPINSVNWYEPEVENQVPKSQNAVRWIKEKIPITRTASWVAEAKKKQRRDQVDVKFCLRTIASIHKVNSGGKDASAVGSGAFTRLVNPTSSDEITALMLCRFLEIQNYIKGEVLEPVGQALLKALSPHQKVNEELLTVFELIMHGCLQPPARKGPRLDQDNVALISNVLSTLPLHSQALRPFPGSFSRPLLEFNSFVKVVNKSLRNLLEMILMQMVLQARPSDDSEYVKVGLKNNYFSDTGDSMGLVFLEWFRIVEESDGDVALAMERACELFDGYCSGGFKAEFDRAVAFWKQVVDAVNCLCAVECVDRDFASAFNQAEAFFAEMR